MSFGYDWPQTELCRGWFGTGTIWPLMTQTEVKVWELSCVKCEEWVWAATRAGLWLTSSYMNWRVSADLPTPPEPTIITLWRGGWGAVWRPFDCIALSADDNQWVTDRCIERCLSPIGEWLIDRLIDTTERNVTQRRANDPNDDRNGLANGKGIAHTVQPTYGSTTMMSHMRSCAHTASVR